ncbi:MAG: DUF4142 domain-containing protein [Verrucomicrobiota bacterium]
MKNKKIFASALIVTSLSAGLLSVVAQTDNTAGQPATPRLKERAAENVGPSHGPDSATAKNLSAAEFIKKAAQGGMMEINLGKVATQHGEDPAVKELGQTLVTDHSKANEQLKAIAQRKGVDLSSEMDSKHEKTMDRFSHLNGTEFDRAFTAHMIRDHQKDIAMFERAAVSNEDADVRAFAKETLPVIKGHLRTAQKLSTKNMKGKKLNEAAGAERDDKPDLTDKNDKLSNEATHEADEDKSPK